MLASASRLTLNTFSNAQQSLTCWDLVWYGEKFLYVCAGPDIIEWELNENFALIKNSTPFERVHEKSVRRLAIADDKLLACAFDSVISMYALQGPEKYKLMGKIEAHESEIKGLAVSPWRQRNNGLLFASCGRDKSVWIHGEYREGPDSAPQFFCSEVLTNHTQDVKSVMFHPFKRMLVSCSYDHTARVYSSCEENDWSQAQILKDHSNSVWDLTFSPDGTFLATCGGDGFVHIYKSTTSTSPGAKELASMQLAQGVLRTALQVAGRNKTRQTDPWLLWSVLNLSLDLKDQPIYSIDWCTYTKGKELWDVFAIGCGDNSIRVYERLREDRKDKDWDIVALQELAHEADVNCVKWQKSTFSASDHRRLLASCGDDGFVKIWDFAV